MCDLESEMNTKLSLRLRQMIYSSNLFRSHTLHCLRHRTTTILIRCKSTLTLARNGCLATTH